MLPLGFALALGQGFTEFVRLELQDLRLLLVDLALAATRGSRPCLTPSGWATTFSRSPRGWAAGALFPPEAALTARRAWAACS